jgi:FlaA1/EpsC-like NDP-sugar epimerase
MAENDRDSLNPKGFVARFGHGLERHRLAIQFSLDVIAWAIGLSTAVVLRYDFTIDPAQWGPFSLASLGVAIAIASSLQLVAGVSNGLYRGRFRFGSFDEVLHLVRTALVAFVGLAAANQLLPRQLLPLSVTAIGSVLALITMAAFRYFWRLILDRNRRPSGEGATRVIVFGAGEAGVQVVTAMLRNPASPYVPVALIDDDPAKRNLRILGVPVAGSRALLAHEAHRLDVHHVVIAIPSASSETLREISDIALEADLRTSVLPHLSELFGSNVGVADIRPITEADLLGRHAIDTDIDVIAGYITDRRVLVTGAGGSIGSELCRQIHRFAPSELIMVDRDESALHAVQLLIEGRALLDTRNLVVADIRDAQRVRDVFAEFQPHVVFHAAALKHLPLLQMHPTEALKTNVFGTQVVLDAASTTGVERFVNISTDKAADPISTLGTTKRLAEMLTSATDGVAAGSYLSVRFGNVLGSRGSVLTSFRAQIEQGGPVTVTDPDVTRYFMTVEEAVQLVIQAGAIGDGGDALVLDMGEPVRIDDVAKRLATESSRRIEIVYTGLRPGEKLHEVLIGAGEVDRRPRHPLISHVAVPPIDIDAIRAATADRDDVALNAALEQLTTTSDRERSGDGEVADHHLAGPIRRSASPLADTDAG